MTGGRHRAIFDWSQEGVTPIFESVAGSPLDDCFGTGSTPGAGTFFCLACGSQLSMRETDELPDCPRCGSGEYRRDSIFESRQDHSEATAEQPVLEPPARPDWLHQARESLSGSKYHLAMRGDDGEIEIVAIERGWTKIGRSATADLRLDDPSVSRRHAMVVAEPGKELRVLDDRSLNGILVNGAKVEWGPLRDGDELAIGRYRLYVLAR